MEKLNQKIGNYRWTICALVFFATTINYLDRSVISLLKAPLTEEFNWTDAEYIYIEIAFKLFYALGMLGAGSLIDKLGTKIGYFLSTLLWSIAAVAHAAVTSTMGFIVARSALGITESGNFPSAIKTVAEWFPKKERALATGIFNSGANIGAIVAPATVPIIAEIWDWRVAFVLTGSVGFIWLIFWFVLYEIPAKQKRVSKAEVDYINEQPAEELTDKYEEPAQKISWLKLLSYRQTWAFVLGKFLTDPIWWFYLFWLPDFLTSEYGIKGKDLSLPVAMVYIISTFGSVAGGWLPLNLIKKHNWPVFKARKTSMLIYAILVVPVVFSQYIGEISVWFAVLAIGWAASTHQAWSANIFTTVSDMFPKSAVASVTGIGGMAGGIGGIMLTFFVQLDMFVYYRSINQIETAYFIMFLICGFAYLLAWLIMHLLVPKMKKIEI